MSCGNFLARVLVSVERRCCLTCPEAPGYHHPPALLPRLKVCKTNGYKKFKLKAKTLPGV